MFVLTVEAHTRSPDALGELVYRWPDDVGPSASGWLGNTAGVSADGDFVLLMRFASEEAALITGDLVGYSSWWRTCSDLLDSTPRFAPSTDVTGIGSGGSDEAAAVQITRGRASPGRMRESARQFTSLTAEQRGTLIGGIVAWHDDDRFTEALYLRAPVTAAQLQVELASGPLGRFNAAREAAMLERTTIELREPWLTSPTVATSRGRPDR